MPYHQYSYCIPATPPGATLRRSSKSSRSSHSRQTSGSYSIDASSPRSATTARTSPRSSPPRQLGQALLPKIRPQDVVVEPASTSSSLHRSPRRVLSHTRSSPSYVVEGRSALISPVRIRSSSKKPSHKRKASTSPEGPRRPVSMYVASTQGPSASSVAPNIVVHPPYAQSYLPDDSMSKIPQTMPWSKTLESDYYQRHVSALDYMNMSSSTTTLLSYLTAPNQAIKLVRNVNVVPTRGMHDYFWWDIRNLRNWDSFSLGTFDSISGLTKLLKTDIPVGLTPPTKVHSSRLAPECETSLIDLIRDIYAPRVNAAVAVSQGRQHLSLYPAPTVRTSVNKNHGCPHFLANYACDTEQTSSGLPRGRLVGIVKSFDRWNTAMRNESPPRRVEYLNGLAHLQRCMREHSCRYGFIMTEIELVCVRAGCDDGDDVPYFGFLELSKPIPTKVAAFSSSYSDRYDRHHSPTPSITTDNSSSTSSRRSRSRTRSRSRSVSHSPLLSPQRRRSTTNPYSSLFACDETLDTPMTASLALYYLLMLSKSVSLPTQPSSHLNVGGPGALTRQRILPDRKDKWIPEPQIGERRDAKRVRGWVWPQDAWHRREGGGVARGRGKTASAGSGKSCNVDVDGNATTLSGGGGGIMASDGYGYGYSYGSGFVYPQGYGYTHPDVYGYGYDDRYGGWYT